MNIAIETSATSTERQKSTLGSNAGQSDARIVTKTLRKPPPAVISVTVI